MKKIISLTLLLGSLHLFAQTYTNDWHLRYSPADTVYGINLNSALNSVPAPLNARKVIVAVIDNGIDIVHPDLQANIWVNRDEIPGNSVDDDHNGYIDDINGWDFLGNVSGDIQYDNLEMTRKLRDYNKRFEGITSKNVDKKDKKEFKEYLSLYKKFYKIYDPLQKRYFAVKANKEEVDLLIREIGKDDPSFDELLNFEPSSNEAKLARRRTLDICKKNNLVPSAYFKSVKGSYEYFNVQYNYYYNLDYDPRSKIGDNYLDITDNKYGNNEVSGPSPDHGTHVAGIIGAVRNNNLGMDGICPLVEIMVLRVVPDGDERDKDIALAIRYAVDNGAKVINMSFGKAYGFNKKIVDDAVRYAESKDVLIIHAAGNDGKNLEKESNFPTPFYEDGKKCSTWIEVGASNIDQNPTFFSNYGKKTVNVFAPGQRIYSTTPDEKYAKFDGTSMAAPVVAGLAALIRAYYPHLTAAQVKQIIESTVDKPTEKVRKPGRKRKKKTKYKKICTSAGVINAEAALKAAANTK